MTSYLYLGSIVLSTICTGLVDHGWRLFLFARPACALVVLGAGVLYFLLWDLIAIGLGIYVRGESAAMTGIEVGPELPVEEIFFVAFLCYLTMVLHNLVHRLLRRAPHSVGAQGSR